MVEWLSNVSANLVGSLIGAAFGFYLAMWQEKKKSMAVERANSLRLIELLVIELRKIYDDLIDPHKGGQNIFDTPILDSTAKEQADVFSNSRDLLRSLVEIRRLSKIISQKTISTCSPILKPKNKIRFTLLSKVTVGNCWKVCEPTKII